MLVNVKKISDILLSELSQVTEIQKELADTVDSFPKGTIVKKTIKGKPYYYIARRDGKKVRFSYLGKLDNGDLAAMKKAFALRRKYTAFIGSLKRQAASLKRLLKALDKA